MCLPGSLRASAVASLLLCFLVDGAAQERAPARDASSRLLAESRAFLNANDLERARAGIEKVLARDPASGDAHYLLGLLAERQKDLEAAAASYARAIQYAPRMAEAHDRLGFVRGQQGRTSDAIA